MSSAINLILRWKERLNRLNTIHAGAKIAPSARIIGSKISGQAEIGQRSKVFKSVLTGKIIIGNNTSIWGPNTDMYASIHEIRVGNFCSVARNVSMQEFNHKYNRITTYYIEQNVFGIKPANDIYSNGPIIIGNDVWIGAHSVIVSGATIGNGAIIAANSVVTGSIPPYAIAGGSPAKVLKYRFEEEVVAALEKIAWWDWPIDKIKQEQSLFLKEQIMLEDLLPFIEVK